MLNAKHLNYIACRKGTIYNIGCSFGLWGRITNDLAVGDINNLKEAKSQMLDLSKEHTVYRAVLSLKEETAVNQGYPSRNEWQELISGHIDVIAKEMDIAQKDFRWCASYHHEKGHPHVHLMFWDSSSTIHTEHIPEERFEIMSEKVRAAFNKDIFKEQLSELFNEQNKIKKEIRAGANNFLGDFTELTYFSDENNAIVSPVCFYPKTIKNSALEQLSSDLDNLLFLLPKTGQLKYQYLSPHLKKLLDSVSQQVTDVTTLKQLINEHMRIARDISKTYGNSEKSILFMQDKVAKRVMQDVGNDVLRTIKDNNLLENIEPLAREAASLTADSELDLAVESVVSMKIMETDFSERLKDVALEFPSRLTPKHEILKDPKISNALRALTLECLTEETVKTAIFTRKTLAKNAVEVYPDEKPTGSSSKEDKRTNGDQYTLSETPIKENVAKELSDQIDNDTYKKAYNKIYKQLYNTVTSTLNYAAQGKQANVMSFLTSFCRSAQQGRLQGESGRFLLHRELSKLAKKERVLAHKDSSNMWESETCF